MMKMIKCKVCETEFEPKKEDRYTANGTVSMFGGDEKDCFDCPQCGCQIVVGTRYTKKSEFFFSMSAPDDFKKVVTGEVTE